MKNKKRDLDRIRIKRFTAIDILLCVIVVVSSVYIGVRFFNLDNEDKDYDVEFKAVFVLPESRETAFVVGDVVLTDDGISSIGEITDISVSPARKKSFNLTVDNESDSTVSKEIVYETNIDGYIEVIITISAELLYESDMYYFNGAPLKIGSEIELTTKNSSAYGECISIIEK